MSIRINVGAKFDARDLQRARRELEALARQGETTSARMLRLSDTMKRVGGQMTAAGRTMTRRITAPIVALGGFAVKTAVDFEESFTKIQGLVGVSADEIAELQDAAKRLGPSLGRSSTEAAEALFFITSAGLRGTEAIQALEMSLKASAVGLGDTATVADLVTSAMNAYGSATLDATRATDVLTMAVRLGKLAPEELAGSIGQVLPLASAMGVTFNDVGAAFAAMSRTGTNASVAATQLRQILSALQKPSADANKQLEELGLNAADLRKQLREKGLLSVLETLTSSFGDNEEAAGRVFGNIRALSGVLDLMGGNVAATRDVFGGMNDVLGVTDDALATTAEGSAFQFQVALQEMREALRKVGEDLLPFVRSAVDGLSNLVKRFTDLDSEGQKAILKFVGIVAVGGPLLIFLGSLITALGTIAGLLGVIGLFAAGIGLVAVAAGAAYFATRDLNHELSKTPSLARGGFESFDAGNLDPGGVPGAAKALADAAAASAAFNEKEVEGWVIRQQSAERLAAQGKVARELAAAFDGVTEATETSSTATSAAGPKVVSLTRQMREMLQQVNETNVGTSDAGDSIAQFAREVLAAGRITDETARAATRLAQVVRQDIDKALAEGNRRLDEARKKFEEYRDAIAGGIRRGNSLSDAVNEQTSALDALTRAQEDYDAAVKSDDPERLRETKKALDEAKRSQTTFISFLETGVKTAEGFAAQIDALREAGASMDVVRQIAELGARTGGRVIEELMAGGAAAIEQANNLVAAVETVSIQAGVAAAQQFHGAGVRAAKAFVAAVEATVPELQSVLDRIADMIEKALGVRPDVSISGQRTFIEPPSSTPSSGATPAARQPLTAADLPNLITGLEWGRGGLPYIPGLATGGVVTSPMFAMIGEAGPEAVIPLDRMGGMGGSIVINVTGAIDPEGTARTIIRTLRDAERRTGERLLT
jgi:TP901 family phage tail tape measure protein